jgi:hypothetical protein
MDTFAIITPTYAKHFQFIKKYLASFDRHVADKHDIPIYFTISSGEIDEFKNIIAPYKGRLDLRILYFEDLLDEFGTGISGQELMEKYGRYSYQTLKKFYTMMHAPENKFLVLDSESMWMRRTRMKDEASKYFSNPFLCASSLDDPRRNNIEFNTMKGNIDFILNYRCPMWPLEHFMWYYDKNIISSLFAEHGSLKDMLVRLAEHNKALDIEVLEQFGIFEIVLYYNYIYKNAARFGYNVHVIERIFDKYIGKAERKKYEDAFYAKYSGKCGILERAPVFVTKRNFRMFANVFKSLDLNIIRDQGEYTPSTYKYQRKFLQIVKPIILAASQNHDFGENTTFEKRYNIIIRQSRTAIMHREALQRIKDKNRPIWLLPLDFARLLHLSTSLLLRIIRNLGMIIK